MTDPAVPLDGDPSASRIEDIEDINDADDAGSLRLARRVLRGLIRCGLQQAVIAPGSRNAPLAYALAEAEAAGAVTVHVRTDERAAAFTAVGIALRSMRPTAVITTSGTAAGNLLPAVMEADHTGVPLIAVTADRPEELHGIGANQTTWQQGMFAGRVRAELHLEQSHVPLDPAPDHPAPDCPAPDHSAPDHPAPERPASGAGSDPGPSGAAQAAEPRVVQVLCRALAGGSAERGEPASGPVHLNLGFRDPLVPAPGLSAPMTAAGRHWAQVSSTVPASNTVPAGSTVPASSPVPEAGADPARRAEPPSSLQVRRTVVVVGHTTPGSRGAAAEALEIARRLGQPVLAEPTSGVRWGAPDSPAVQGYRPLLEAPEGTSAAKLAGQVERVVVVGRPTLSRPVQRLLTRRDVEAVHYLPVPEPWYRRLQSLPRPVLSDPAQLGDFIGRAPADWLHRWSAMGERVQRQIDAELAEGELSSVRAAQFVAEHADTELLLGSSSVIRDVDLAGGRRAQDPGTYALRGLAGIDGNLSAAAGLALDSDRRVTALVGDLTFLHDLNALLIPAQERVPELDVVVINDHGGAIFDQLEHGEVGRRAGHSHAVERFFGTPHTAGVGELVRGLGHDHLWARSLRELEAALDGAEQRRGIRVVEVRTERSGLRDLHARIAGAAAEL